MMNILFRISIAPRTATMIAAIVLVLLVTI